MRRAFIGWIGAGLAALLALSAQGACGSSRGSGGGTGTSGTASSSTTSSSTGSSSGGATSSSSGTGGATSSSTSTSSSTGTPMVGDSVLTHHKNPSRDGLYVQPTFTKAAVGTLHRDTAFSPTLPVVDGQTQQIFAQPLFVDGMGGQDLVIVATGQNNVYALDAATGAQVWTKNLGPPVPLGQLPCGNIDPNGVTGTPVIDLTLRTIFLDAMVLVSSGTAPPPHHQIFALALDTGDIKAGWPVEVDAAATSGTTRFNSAFQGQRGALALLGGTLYVPYGGLFGDCQPQATGLYPGTAPYHGWVVAVAASDPTKVSAWATPAVAGGMWAPNGISTDGTDLFVSTGNTQGTNGTWGGGDAFLRLAASPLGMSRYFAPRNWLALDNGDLDIGTGPIPFDLSGATPSALAILFGKDGNAYLVDRANPGSVSAALGANAAACTATNTANACASLHVATDEIISAPALYTTATATYVATRGNGSQCSNGSGDLLTIKIVPGSPPTVQMGWCAANGAGSPMVTTSDGHADAIVWDLGAENDNRLHAFDGDTGAAIPFTDSTLSIPGMRRYNTPIAGKGRIFVPVDGGVAAFKL